MAQPSAAADILKTLGEFQSSQYGLTGDNPDREHLAGYLRGSIQHALRIDIIVSFLMVSGVREIIHDLEDASRRGVQIRILTGTYLGITAPEALCLLKDRIRQNLDLRLYNNPNRSFHPKSYIFHYDNDLHEIFIGSSNISKSALTSGIEWNYRFTSVTDEAGFIKFYGVFEDLFYNHSVIADDSLIRDYSRSWHRPVAFRGTDLYESEAAPTVENSAGISHFLSDYGNADSSPGNEPVCIPEGGIKPVYEPRGAQIEALYALNNARRDGSSKCLVVAATGVGKTALAAFDSLPYKKILFVVHRQEILQQAARTFAAVRRTDSIGYFNADEKTTDRDVILASVSTLGSDRYLNTSFFSPDHFDYVIMDEIHHGVAAQYRRILDYFQPRFLLGLTATPERLDQKSIFELFDYNVPYEISLTEAINKGYLVPFSYHGIFDEFTDYSGVKTVNGRYVQSDLTEIYCGNLKRQDLIIRHYCKFKSKHALGFCCSREHAEEMAKAFSERKIRAVAVYSNADGEFSENRNTAVQKLAEGKIEVIFSVDMFNEGVDISSVDLVMFLRPTESPVVFLQQLGRGLRLDRNKKRLTVLDFIGNYRNADRIRLLLGSPEHSRTKKGNTTADKIIQNSADQLPDGCDIDFDIRLIDLFERMDRKHRKIESLIEQEYWRIKNEIGRRPMRHDLFINMDDTVYQLAAEHSKHNIFKNYLEFLGKINELTDGEKILCRSIGKEFIAALENTNMTRVYKMPVLRAFVETRENSTSADRNAESRNTEDAVMNIDPANDSLSKISGNTGTADEKLNSTVQDGIQNEKMHMEKDTPGSEKTASDCAAPSADRSEAVSPQSVLRLRVSPEILIDSWKKFFLTAGNWRDLAPDMTLDKFRKLPDGWHRRKIYSMPVKFLTKSDGTFFRLDKNSCLCLTDELEKLSSDASLLSHVRDVIAYRTADYYRRRYKSEHYPGH